MAGDVDRWAYSSRVVAGVCGALIASRSSGTCWYSSIRTGSPDSTNLPGSARTADLVDGSSQSITGRPRRSASWLSRVLLPTVRGPLSTITGSSVNRAVATSAKRRFTSPVRTSRMTRCYPGPARIPAIVFRISGASVPVFRHLAAAIPSSRLRGAGSARPGAVVSRARAEVDVLVIGAGVVGPTGSSCRPRCATSSRSPGVRAPSLEAPPIASAGR